jgi:hypothetical protein
LHRLADALDVTTDYLLGRVNERDGLAGADKRHRHYDRLTSDGRDAADSVMEMLAKSREPRAQRRKIRRDRASRRDLQYIASSDGIPCPAQQKAAALLFLRFAAVCAGIGRIAVSAAARPPAARSQ